MPAQPAAETLATDLAPARFEFHPGSDHSRTFGAGRVEIHAFELKLRDRGVALV
jgi:hypothetical protein